jgi:hypothetical protein
MNVFISYGSLADQVTALCLQTLGAVQGLIVYVAPAYTRKESSTLLDSEAAQKLRDADMILGVISTGMSEACRQELNTARTLAKPTVVMADPSLAPALQPYFGPSLVVIDPEHPDATERAIVEQLRAIQTEQQATKALIALGTFALGFLLFASQD